MKPYTVIKTTFSLLIVLVFVTQGVASHLRAGEISAIRLNCSSLTYRITVTVFLDTQFGVMFGGEDDWLEFGDGERMLIDPVRTTPQPDLGTYMGTASFTIDYTYQGAGTYTISYSEPFRNDGVVNMDHPGSTKFYVETRVIIDPYLGCNRNLPVLGVPPIDKACVGVSFFHNPEASDKDGDSLSYEIIVPKQALGTEVNNFKDPNSPVFYTQYNSGNEEKNGTPTFSIHPINGTLIWDAPGAAGEYNIAFRINEWRRDPEGKYQLLSYVVRDMQVVVEDCDNQRPDLLIPDDTCVVAGATLEKVIYGTDPDGDDVKIEVFSSLLRLSSSPAYISPNPPYYQPSDPPAQLYFLWNTECLHVRDQYYDVVFKITDNPSDGPKLVTFKTWRIKVIGPAPVWKNITEVNGKNNISLQWDRYACDNAATMQVWRKVDDSTYNPDECETGMPPHLGYSLITTIPLKDISGNTPVTTFTDTNGGKGLPPGATYCYRLVALFADAGGGESYVSLDTCITSRARAPVITHVTVEKTDPVDGRIRVSWRSPFDIDLQLYPGPYEYEIFRGNGFESDPTVRVTPEGRTRDTTFVDEGLNTEGEVYNYTIVLYTNTVAGPAQWIAHDTSATASSVRLEIIPAAETIRLQWNAVVPWSNYSDRYPRHLIYRGEGNAGEEDLQLIDSVDVTENGFTYVDQGTFNNTPLEPGKLYCYKIQTRGVYGNPAIDEPLLNYAQMICAPLDDERSPCKPVLSLMAQNCEEIFAASGCMVNNFKNTLSWNNASGPACDGDIRGYNIYVAENMKREFTFLRHVKDTFYTDTQLRSFARCYRIAAVDQSGRESEWSEVVCNDNCPYFALPNVFTPNNDGCNDYFSAYGPFNPMVDPQTSCSLANEDGCARFVEKVYFKVFNRWGEQVYAFESGSTEYDYYINWNGKDDTGGLVSSGIYYYSAEVYFDTVDPDRKIGKYNGWVNVIH